MGAIVSSATTNLQAMLAKLSVTLQTNQRAIDTSSENIMNVSTPGYKRRVMSQKNAVFAERSMGVQVEKIERMVNEFTLKELRSQNGIAAKDSVKLDYLRQIEHEYGRPDDQNSLTSYLTKFAETMRALSARPERGVERNAFRDAAVSLTQKLRDLSDDIQDKRLKAETRIGETINLINTKVGQIHTLNNQIKKYNCDSNEPNELLDQRDQLLDDVSKLVNLKIMHHDDNTVSLWIDGTSVRLLGVRQFNLEYTAVKAMNPLMTHSGGQIGDITVEAENGFTDDVTSLIAQGDLKALIDFRDTDGVYMQTELDELAQKIRDEINTLHNQGSAFTAPETLTGRSLGADAAAALAVTLNDSGTAPSGILRISLTDDDGKNVRTEDINLATANGGGAITTVQELVDSINAAFALRAGAEGNLATGNTVTFAATTVASVTANGQLQLSIGATPTATDDVTGDVYTATGISIVSKEFVMPGVEPFNFPAGAAVTAGDKDDDLVATDAISIEALGPASTVGGVQTYQSYGFSDFFGLNDFFSTSRGETEYTKYSFGGAGSDDENVIVRQGLAQIIDVRSDIKSNSDLIAVGKLMARDIPYRTPREQMDDDLTAAPYDVASMVNRARYVGQTMLTSGDNATIKSMADKLEEAIQYRTSVTSNKGLSDLNTSLISYSVEILGYLANEIHCSDIAKEMSQSYLDELVKYEGDYSGVNLEQEMIRLMLGQRNFTATGKTIQTVSETFDVIFAWI